MALGLIDPVYLNRKLSLIKIYPCMRNIKYEKTHRSWELENE
jgi:hypothetical protein